jgi:hypothetical protein
MKTKKTRAVCSALFILFLVGTLHSCVDHTLPEVEVDECGGTVSFDIDIEPIIDSKCAIVGDGGCHNGGNGASLDWRVFSNFQGKASSVKDRITRAPGSDGKMPKIGTLTNDQIQLIVCWVDQGAKDN